mmetsp:Transcript_44370/g.142125  ORF Transcript_44370/g.142125 Transcript_44370/m.142125 type:complete len:476 (-) Transcript_44370:413-1840(-)
MVAGVGLPVHAGLVQLQQLPTLSLGGFQQAAASSAALPGQTTASTAAPSVAAASALLTGAAALRSAGRGRRRHCGCTAGSVRSAVVLRAGGDQDFPLVNVARGLSPAELTGPRVPMWVFRQAGRHMPEYNEYKAKTGKNFLELLRDPKDVAEVTLQPLRRYKVDAAILFSDILVVAEALGVRVEMPGGKGILVPEPLRSPADLSVLPAEAETDTAAFVEDKLSHVLAAVRLILEKMKEEGFGDRPLIGFSAAPWTLFFYMVGGSSRKNQKEGERWLAENQEASKKLLDLLTKVIIEYLSAQARNGAHVLQVFEAMGEHISEENFTRWALPAMTEIAAELKRRHPTVPLMVFPRGASYSLAALQTAGYDVVSVDTETNLGEAASALKAEAARTGGGRVAALQGNFDPKWLRTGEGGSVEVVRREVQRMFDSLGPVAGFGQNGLPALIANLGEGLNGTESVELVAAFVDSVHELSTK